MGPFLFRIYSAIYEEALDTGRIFNVKVKNQSSQKTTIQMNKELAHLCEWKCWLPVGLLLSQFLRVRLLRDP